MSVSLFGEGSFYGNGATLVDAGSWSPATALNHRSTASLPIPLTGPKAFCAARATCVC